MGAVAGGVREFVSLGVTDLDRSRVFYDAVLVHVSASRRWTAEGGLGYGTPGREQLDLFLHPPPVQSGAGFHLAFAAPSRTGVDRFHEAALQTGGVCVGPPGPRPQYGPHYYAAFVLDPDGHKLEAVYQGRP